MTGIKAEYICHMGDDKLVANAARVSFKKWVDEFTEKDTKLINYLAKHKHISPFFHPQVTLRITAPVFVANQAKRHQIGFAVNEASRRYIDDEPDFWQADSWRSRPEGSIKQGSGAGIDDQSTAASIYRQITEQASAAYESLLRLNVAPEQARAILPQSMLTQWIWTGSLYAWTRLCTQRLDEHAQVEIRQLAQQIANIVGELYPVSWAALMEHGRG